MAFPITWEDVQTRLGRQLTEFEKAQVDEWIKDLEADIRHRIPEIDDLMSDPDYTRMVVRVVAETIVVKLRNPEGLRQLTHSIDDYSTTKTVDSANSSGRLEISAEDWAKLIPAVDGDAFSIRMGGKYAAGSWPS